jgi:hypothetical protein
MGCPTVLIGETGGGGGGAGAGVSRGGSADVPVEATAASSGTGDNATVTSGVGAAVATAGGPPNKGKRKRHWVTYEFVDTAGNPIHGVHYRYKNSDGKESTGTLPTKGTIERRGIPAGNTDAHLRSLTNARWNKKEAKTDEQLKLTAEADGFDDGTPASITIYERDLHTPDDLVERIETSVKGNKVEAEWKYKYTEEDEDEKRAAKAATGAVPPSHPEYYFIARAAECEAVSGLLLFKDWIEVELKDEDGEPVQNAKYRMVLPSGEIRPGSLDGSGRAKLENLPPGKCKIEFDWF